MILSYSVAHYVTVRDIYGRFLSQGVWQEDYVWHSIRKQVLSRVKRPIRQFHQPLLVIYDDTVSEKTEPSSKAKRQIEKTAFHHSHLDHKQVRGHQFLAALHAFLCTDTQLDTQMILKYYSQRWPIEIFFRQSKGNLGLGVHTGFRTL